MRVSLLAICATLATLAVIAESTTIRNPKEPCYQCAEEAKRKKRDAPAVLNSVSNLVNGILDTNWSYITRLNAQKLAAQRQPQNVYVGQGRNNNNRLMFNGGRWKVHEQY